jgi:hypothetical protein
MNIKQILGTLFILTVLTCTLFGVLGIWGFIQGDTVYQLVGTLLVVAVGLGVSGSMIDQFFKDK